MNSLWVEVEIEMNAKYKAQKMILFVCIKYNNTTQAGRQAGVLHKVCPRFTSLEVIYLIYNT